MNFANKYFLAFLILGICTKGFGQVDKEILKLSLPEAQSYAIENNRSVQAAKIDIYSADKKVWENLATGLPQVSLSANYLHQFKIPELSFGPYLDVDALPDGALFKSDIIDAYKASPPISLGVKNNTTIDLTVSQLIFSGQYIVGLQASKVVKELTEKNLVRTEDQTRESVAGTYHLILVLGENVRLLTKSLQSVDQTYNDMVKMNEQGLNEEPDVDHIKINRSNIQTLITAMESQREISSKLLKFQLGLDFDRRIELTDSLPGIIKEGNIKYLVSPEYDVNASIDYQLVRTQEEISSLLLKLEKSKYLPTLAAFYRHEEQTNQPSFNFAVKDVIGASFSLPIVSSGMRNARIAQARFDLEKSQLAKDNAEQGLIMEFETAWSDYQTAYSNFTTNSESMELGRKVYERTVIKFREGVSSSFELTQSQNQFLTAETNYYNSVLALLNAKAKLDRILNTSN
jgi:outer membrane protein